MPRPLARFLPVLGGLCLSAAFFSGCGILYTNNREPYVYRAPTSADVEASADDPTVHGRACEYYLLYLFNWGNRGYAATVKSALKDPEHYMLYNDKFDQKYDSVLAGLYLRQCTVLTARVGKL